jgi:hypothetical protein
MMTFPATSLEKDLLIHEVSDEALEAAGGHDAAGNYTLAYCTRPQFAQPDRCGHEATGKLIGDFCCAMDHHIRAFLNSIGAGVSAVLADLGLAHLGRFRAFTFAGTSHGFGCGPQPCPRRARLRGKCSTDRQ